jgi:predicted nucleic acid-binding protein
MIGLDTNVLVRYMAQDDPIQSKLATDLIERRLADRDPGFISIVAMTETAWVLERAYGCPARKSPERSSARCRQMCSLSKASRKSLRRRSHSGKRAALSPTL